jgi:hypothetical protein
LCSIDKQRITVHLSFLIPRPSTHAAVARAGPRIASWHAGCRAPTQCPTRASGRLRPPLWSPLAAGGLCGADVRLGARLPAAALLLSKEISGGLRGLREVDPQQLLMSLLFNHVTHIIARPRTHNLYAGAAGAAAAGRRRRRRISICGGEWSWKMPNGSSGSASSQSQSRARRLSSTCRRGERAGGHEGVLETGPRDTVTLMRPRLHGNESAALP